MDLIGYYLLFALSAAITACYVWFWPMLQQAKAKGISNELTNSPLLAILVFITITTLIAPIVILPLIIPGVDKSFASGLEREVMKQD